jgi:hypothetical protein
VCRSVSEKLAEKLFPLGDEIHLSHLTNTARRRVLPPSTPDTTQAEYLQLSAKNARFSKYEAPAPADAGQ